MPPDPTSILLTSHEPSIVFRLAHTDTLPEDGVVAGAHMFHDADGSDVRAISPCEVLLI